MRKPSANRSGDGTEMARLNDTGMGMNRKPEMDLDQDRGIRIAQDMVNREDIDMYGDFAHRQSISHIIYMCPG